MSGCCSFTGDGFGGTGGGGGSAGPVPAVSNGLYFVDDFLNNTLSEFTPTGGSASVTWGGSAVIANSPGIVTPAMSTVGDSASIHGAQESMRMGGGEVTIIWRVFFPVLSDGGDRFVLRIGLGDDFTNNDFADGVYFEYDFDTYGDQEWRAATANNSARTKVDTNVPAVAGTYQNLKAVINAAGTSVEFFIDGVSVATIATNIPTARQTGYCAQLTKVVGAGSRSAVIDFVSLSQTFTTAR